MLTISSTECLAAPPANDAATASGIQPAGFLLVASRDWLIERASANLAKWLGRDPESVIGQPLSGLLGGPATHSIRNQLSLVRTGGHPAHLCGCAVGDSSATFDFIIQAEGERANVEGLPAAKTEARDTIATVRALVERLEATPSLADLLAGAARQLRALTGYDRVALYRHDADGSLTIMADAARSLGPALAAQAGGEAALIVGDVAAGPVPVLGGPCPARALLRAPGAAEAASIRRSGAAARWTHPLIVGGAPWGMIVCDHPSPRTPSVERQSAMGLFAHMLAMLVRLRS